MSLLPSSQAAPLFQTPPQLDIEIENLPATVEVGQTFTFNVGYSCSGLESNCEDVQILIDFPAAGISDSGAIITTGSPNLNYTGPTAGDITLLCDGTTGSPCLTAGNGAIATITVRVANNAFYDLGGAPNPPLPLTVRVIQPNASTQNFTLTVEQPVFDWNLTKTRVTPPPGAPEPAIGYPVTYQMSLCNPKTGNYDLNNVIITDTLDPAAQFISATNGGTISGQVGGLGGIVSWGPISRSFTADGCLNYYVTVEYPSDPGGAVSNQAEMTFTYNDPDVDPNPIPGDCTSLINPGGTSACTGGTHTHNFEPPQANPVMQKVLASGETTGINGLARFNLNFDNIDSNVPLANVVFRDYLPPNLDFAGVTLPVFSPAPQLLYSSNATCQTDAIGSFSIYDPDDPANSSDTFTNPALVRCLAWQWAGANTFPAGGNYQVQIQTRSSIAGTYNNCSSLTYDISGGATGQSFPDTCDSVIVNTDPGLVTLSTNKFSNPTQPEHGTDAEFVLSATITERAAVRPNALTFVEALPAPFVITDTAADSAVLAWTPADALLNPPTVTRLTTYTRTVDAELRPVYTWQITNINYDTAALDFNEEVMLFLTVQGSVERYAAPDTYGNFAYFYFEDGANLACEGDSNLVVDINDMDNDGDNTESVCELEREIEVPVDNNLLGQKWIRNEDPDPGMRLAVVPGTYYSETYSDDGSSVLGDTPDRCPFFNDLAGTFTIPPPVTNAATTSTADYNRYNCISEGYPFTAVEAQTSNDNTFSYLITVSNDGNSTLNNYILYDILPYPGDTGVRVNAARGSQWRPRLLPDGTGTVIEVVAVGSSVGNPLDFSASDFVFEYNTSNDPCRVEVKADETVCGTPWTGAPASPTNPASWANISAFRVSMPDTSRTIQPGDYFVLRVRMYIPLEEANPALAPKSGDIAWNSYAHTAFSTANNAYIPASEPLKVGIRVPETVSVGNRVWLDRDNNGIQDIGEPGIANVTVELYEYDTALLTGSPDDPSPHDPTNRGTLIGQTVTDTNGYYIFNLYDTSDNSPDRTVNYGNAIPVNLRDPNKYYVVVIPTSNFDDPGDPLEFLRSSDPESTGDSRDKGVPVTPGADGNPLIYPANYDVYSVFNGNQLFRLQPNQEPTNDDDLRADLDPTNAINPASLDDRFGAIGHGNLGQSDNNSDLTLDFGFYHAMSLGNRVWLDDGWNGSTIVPASRNNGVIDAGERGINGVQVDLYRNDGDGIFEPGGDDALVGTQLTHSDDDAAGYYLFENLTPAGYWVHIPALNFTFGDNTNGYTDAPLAFYVNSTNVGGVDGDDNDSGLDSNDNGQNHPSHPDYRTTGVRSSLITLAPRDEASPLNPPDDTDLESGVGNGHTDPPARTSEIEDEDSDLTIDFGFYPLPMSLGNRVWLDSGNGNPTLGNDGLLNNSEAGIDGVTVTLYRDDPASGTQGQYDAADDLVATTVTVNGGYYLFDREGAENLPPGRYFVVLPASNFDATPDPTYGLQLYRHFSSTGADHDENEDLNDNGTDPADGNSNGVDVADYTNGVHSQIVYILPLGEPNEGDLNTAGSGGGNGTDFYPPNAPVTFNNSDQTVDFGFYMKMSIGNRVWRDDYNDPAETPGSANPGDGRREPNATFDNGVDGVEVQLYLDNGNNIFDAGTDTLVNTVLTANGGYYLFETWANSAPILPGNYFVHITAANFDTAGDVLYQHFSSDGMDGDNSDNREDNDDNGEQGANPQIAPTPLPAVGGVTSELINLSYQAEPILDSSTAPNDETDKLLNVDDGRDIFDPNGELTIDFGFFIPPLSLGNRVWYDADRNGVFNAATENGIAGVLVQLHNASDLNTVIDFTTTNSSGYYVFDHLLPGDYVVRIAPNNWASSGDVLYDYVSTALRTPADPDNDVNMNDNGINPATAIDYESAGVLSDPITLAPYTEPDTSSADNDEDTVDLDASGSSGPNGRGFFDEDDNDSNLSVDFGFFIPLSIGNRVWLDDGAGTPANRNNGQIDTGETFLTGVTLSLFRDANNNGNIDAGEDYNYDGATNVATTDASGFYIFDWLPEGDYIVVVDATNFQAGGALLDTAYPGNILFSSTGNGADDGSDGDDNGMDTDLPSLNGVRSPVINLALAQEPANTPPTADPANNDQEQPGVVHGRNRERDDNSDLTVDFGFVTAPMSIGNFVWKDFDNDAEYDLGVDQPVAGALVALYRSDGDTQFEPYGATGLDTRIAEDTTDANGYYLFDNLPPGTYFVLIDEDNFRTGGVLEDFFSTNDRATQTDKNVDSPNIDEDGIDDPLNPTAVYPGATPNVPPNPELIGIHSPFIVLVTETENTSEELGKFGDGRNGERPTNTNLTVDFAFYKPMSIGNRVWFDQNVDGLISAGETGADNVRVELYLDVDNDSLFEPGADDGAFLRFDITSNNGYYLFDNLIPGNYFVWIAPANFASGAVLDGLMSTITDQPNTALSQPLDSNDNGIDPANYLTEGVVSNRITLAVDSAPQQELDTSPRIIDGPSRIGRNGETGANSDITIDFGFTPPAMSLGNRVWLDTNHNGLRDDLTENGVADVVVNLYLDTDANNTPNGGVYRTTTTDADGYYLFSNLVPGNYVVSIASVNFTGSGVLNGLIPTLFNQNNPLESGTYPTVDDQDDNSNGVIPIVAPANAPYGVLSRSISLTRTLERDDEIDVDNDPVGEGNGVGIAAEDSDLTVDFGFFQPMSIGNRVWWDADNSGTINNGEQGIPAISVTLYEDTNTNGIFEPGAGDTQIETTTTDLNGYYLFDGLQPARYFVRINGSNFDNTSGGILYGAASSTGHTSDDQDNNDNGVDAANPLTNGVVSEVIILTLNTAPTTETDPGPGGNGGNGETNANANLSIDFGFVPGEAYSIGNRVWYDLNHNGVIDGAETGISLIGVSLYTDSDLNGLPDGAAIRNDVTDGNGYYLFGNLTPGHYLVGIDAANFDVSGRLQGYAPTLVTPNPPINDSNNNYVNPPLPQPYDPFYGIVSNRITLIEGTIPVNETDLSQNAADGAPGYRGVNGEADNNSDLTIDFGFYKPMSLGNRVWFDINPNGLMDIGETGIQGVTVQLFADLNGNGQVDVGEDTPLQTDVTDGGGYYLFSGLVPGQYLVAIAETNFLPGSPLEGFTSSVDGQQPIAGDRNDNGRDTADVTGRILSETITLVQDAAPTGETDTSGQASDGPNFRGTNNETDNNSDLTIDFGFTASPMSLGNRIWLDDGAGGGISGNGLLDGGELGIPGVLVQLFSDVNGDGTPDGNVIASDTTDAEGYYLFDGIPPGRYVVRVAPQNFLSSGVLYGLFSTDNETPTNTNQQDHGINNLNPLQMGVLSNSILLRKGMEPTNDHAAGTISNDPSDGPNRWGDNGELDEDSNLAIDFGFTALYDWSDAPVGISGGETYSFGTTGSGGARHRIIPLLRLGSEIDNEADGQPHIAASGDDTTPTLFGGPDDEDGVRLIPFVAGTSGVQVEVTVFNNTGTPATLIGWFDWDGNRMFDPDEAVSIIVPSSPQPQVVFLMVNIPPDADILNDGAGSAANAYARFRLTTNPMTGANATGIATDGEVEDYLITILPPGLALFKTDSRNSIVVGQFTMYTITITNSGQDQTRQRFLDEIPTDPVTGFDPTSISWTCTSSDGASCITNTDAGTGDSGTTPIIDRQIDIPRGGRVVYTITARVRPNHQPATISNTAQLTFDNGEPPIASTDQNGVIYDPPAGQKIGVVRDGNIIRWTMTWINTGALQEDVTITDTPQAGQTFAGNLICRVFGGANTQTDVCIFDGTSVIWMGDIDNGTANRVEIAFDVTIPGDGTYANVATLNVDGATAEAADTVTIGEPEVPAALPGEPGAAALPLVIQKRSDLPFAQPGDQVKWMITVTNPNNFPVPVVTVQDTLPAQFEIIAATSPLGRVILSNQLILVEIDSLEGNRTLEITIITRVRETGSASFCPADTTSITNTACVDSPYQDAICTQATLSCLPPTLPATGESPHSQQRPVLFLLLLLAVGIICSGVIWRLRNNFL